MKKWLKNFKKDQRGLTLVELLAVVVILAIVAAIAFILIGNVIENSRKDAHVSNAQQLISAAKLWEASGNQIGSGVNIKTLQEAGHLGTITDPWTKQGYGESTGIVTKTGNEYHVELSGDKCDIDHDESELIEKGREVCE